MKKLLLMTMTVSLLFADGFETIKKEDYPDKWAFTVNELKIGCEMNLSVVFIKGDYMAYGLTGNSAKAVGRSIDDIWADDKIVKGLKKDLSPFIKIASSHCKN